ncbi:hypothetical protein Mapa_007041 [Marchantia paleacea]|nr:hypothetical protein Mapa_007041 [Marchantia paleacea]
MEGKLGHVQLKRVNVHPGSEHLGSPKQLQGTAVNQDLVHIIVPLIKHMAHLHSHHYRSLRHKGLVREIVSCLWSVTSFVLPSLWQDIWSSTGITYWLARLLEDHEAILRGMAFGILALLATPATPRTRELLKRNWPELGDVAVKSVLNEQECFAVREQETRVLEPTALITFDKKWNSWVLSCFGRTDSEAGNLGYRIYQNEDI